MKTDYGTLLGAALFTTALMIVPAIAGTITEREKRDCPKDYHAYCGEYGLGSEALRACMSRNIKKISSACVGALVDAGEMTQAQADKLRHKAGTTTVTKKAAVTTKKAKVTTKKGKVTAKKTTTAKSTKTTKSAKTVKTATTAKTTKTVKTVKKP
jgi:hypothetical protein